MSWILWNGWSLHSKSEEKRCEQIAIKHRANWIIKIIDWFSQRLDDRYRVFFLGDVFLAEHATGSPSNVWKRYIIYMFDCRSHLAGKKHKGLAKIDFQTREMLFVVAYPLYIKTFWFCHHIWRTYVHHTYLTWCIFNTSIWSNTQFNIW